MKRILLVLTTAALVIGFSDGAAAQQRKAKPKKTELEKGEAMQVECKCPEPAPPVLVQENTLESCRDGVDNDSDGHVDCADQDCEIYSMCVEPEAAPPPPPRPVKVYSTMRQLKADLYAGQLTRHQFNEAWGRLRQARAVELEALKTSYRAGSITRHEYHQARREIINRYEG